MQVLTTTNYAASILSQRGATQGTVVPYGVDHSLFRRMTVLDRRWPATQGIADMGHRGSWRHDGAL